MNDCYFIAKGKHLVVPVTKQEYEDYWNKKRNEPITKEEWFCRLNTVEKAKWLADNFGYVAYKASGGNPKRVQEDLVEYWQEWLKQPHREVGK